MIAMLGRRAHDGDVFLGVMRAPQRGIGDAAADADDRHGQILIAQVDANLLERAVDGKRGDAVGERRAAAQCQAGAQADHALLGHADVDELFGNSCRNGFMLPAGEMSATTMNTSGLLLAISYSVLAK